MSDGGGMGDAGGGGGDLGGGYYGTGPTTTWGSYVYAALGVGLGVSLIVLAPDAWWLGAVFIATAPLWIVMARVGPRFRAWNEQRLKRKPGEPPTMHDLD